MAERVSVKPEYILGMDSINVISHEAIFHRLRIIVIY